MKRELPRIPFVHTWHRRPADGETHAQDAQATRQGAFWCMVGIGERLADLPLNYETAVAVSVETARLMEELKAVAL